MNMLKNVIGAMLCVLMAAHAGISVAADTWPSRPIKLVVPYPPGGSTDVTARLVADKLRSELGQPVVIENRPGAGANIGATLAAKAAPDGYTLLMATSTHTTNPSLYQTLPYEFVKDFAPVSQLTFIPNVLVINKNVPVAGLKEFIAYIRTGTHTVNYGSSGTGSSQHLSAALFNSMAGGKMVHVPYKGGAPAVADLVGGQVQAVFAPLVEVLSMIKAGKLIPLGMTTKKRSPLLPDVPAISEVLSDYEVALWNGILVPTGTPVEIVDKLHRAIVKVLALPEVKRQFAEQGTEVVGSSPAEFKTFIAAEATKWSIVVKLSGAHLE